MPSLRMSVGLMTYKIRLLRLICFARMPQVHPAFVLGMWKRQRALLLLCLVQRGGMFFSHRASRCCPTAP